MRPLDSRLSAERDCKAKYSVSARARICGLSAAMRAMPTNLGAGLKGNTPFDTEGAIEISASAITHFPPARRFPCKTRATLRKLDTFAFCSHIVKGFFRPQEQVIS